MKKMKKTIHYLIRTAAVAVVFLATGCEKLDLTPEGDFSDESFWTSTDRAQIVLNQAYSQMLSSEHYFYNEALSDNAINGRGDVAGSSSIPNGTSDASLGRYLNEWNGRYAGIKTCNILLENIDRVPDADAELVERMKAEARFLRAWQHFMLATWFGDVPLFDHDPTLQEASTVARTPHDEVIAFVLSELDASAAILPTPDGYSTAERGKITKGAAMALKARVLLYEGRWSEVVAVTQDLIDGAFGSYALFPSYSGLFLPDNEFSSEDILSLQYVPVDRVWSEMFDMAPISAGARLNALAPTQELVDSYPMNNGKRIGESGSGYDENNPYANRDPRLTATVVYHGYSWKDKPESTPRTIYIKPGSTPGGPNDPKPDEYGVGSSSPTGYYTRKYWDPTHSANSMQSGLNLMLIRYADVLLMHAEAKNELGAFDAATWDLTVRALRARAGYTDNAALAFPGGGQAELREIIRNERRIELAMEGLRIFDIRRWRIAEDVLNGYVHGAKYGLPGVDNGYIRAGIRVFDESKHYVWPVPRDEYLINPNLGQNPNW